jgi:flavin-dependent dehydrogenase
MNAEIAIIGGGLAGTSAAIELAQAGRDVLLLEREAEPKHKVCGEFLSQEALDSLQALGVNAATLGAAKIHSVRLLNARHAIHAALPFAAMSLTRKCLDEAMLERASAVGARVKRGMRVTHLQREHDHWRISVDGSEDILAKAVFLATGKHDVPGLPRPDGVQRDFVGFKLHLQLALEETAALDGHIELMLFRGGYAGLACVEDGGANLGWIVHRRELLRHGGVEGMLKAMQQQCPQLAERLRNAEPLLAKPLAISPIPYGFVRKTSADGIWFLGDQAAVIPSFTGDGMSIALHSGRLAATMYVNGADAASYQRTLAAQLRRQVWLATILSRGLTWTPSRAMITAAMRVWPGSIAWAAKSTRISESVQL